MRAGVPLAGGKVGITFTFLPPHFEQTKCRCFGTSTKIMSFQSFSSSNVVTACEPCNALPSRLCFTGGQQTSVQGENNAY